MTRMTVGSIRHTSFYAAVPLLLLVGLLGGCAREEAQNADPRTSAAPSGASTPSGQPGNWSTYNGPLSGDRYSPLAQIDVGNVGQLRQACAFDAPEAVNFQSGIVAVNGVLYFTLFNHTYAVDGATCQQKWKHTRPEPDTFLMVNRGVAYSDGKLFRGTGDAHVVAINAADGAQILGRLNRRPEERRVGTDGAPCMERPRLAGNAGGDNFGVIGRIYALNAASGRVVWQFNTVPDSGPARATWPKASPDNPPGGGAPGPAMPSMT